MGRPFGGGLRRCCWAIATELECVGYEQGVVGWTGSVLLCFADGSGDAWGVSWRTSLSRPFLHEMKSYMYRLYTATVLP